jgi:predicted metal-dependent hydrolase
MPHPFQKLKRAIKTLHKKSLKAVGPPARTPRPIRISQRQIILTGQEIEYTLRVNPRSKSIRLAIHAGGEFIVTAPPRATQTMIESLIKLKANWILDKINHFKNVVKVPRNSKAEQKAEYVRLKKDALKIATEKVVYWNSFYNFKYKNISIKNQKTRWGSCSRNGNLNFNYKIAIIPDKLADYLVVHEICHLGEFNHSAKFWALVAKTIPDYKTVRRELKGIK